MSVNNTEETQSHLLPTILLSKVPLQELLERFISVFVPGSSELEIKGKLRSRTRGYGNECCVGTVLSISTQRKAKASSTVGCTVEEGIFLKKVK